MRVLAIAVILLAAAPPAFADVFLFKMPSENVVCSVGLEADMSDIQCEINERSGPPAAPAPANCASTWGHVFLMRNTGPVEMICSDFNRGLAASVSDVADYGLTSDFGGISCTSSRSGLECRNSSGHGFFLSRKSQSVF